MHFHVSDNKIYSCELYDDLNFQIIGKHLVHGPYNMLKYTLKIGIILSKILLEPLPEIECVTAHNFFDNYC